MERITNITELHNRIDELELAKDIQELQIKRDVKDFVHSLKPSVLIKNAFHKMTDGGEGEGSVLSNLGFGLLGRVLGTKNKSVVGALKSVVGVQIAKMAYNKYEDQINGFVGGLGSKIGHWFQLQKEKLMDRLHSDDDDKDEDEKDLLI